MARRASVNSSSLAPTADSCYVRFPIKSSQASVVFAGHLHSYTESLREVKVSLMVQMGSTLSSYLLLSNCLSFLPYFPSA